MLISVLFVDDDANAILALKRTLRNMRNDWEMFFAESGRQALAIMREHHIKVVACDLLMADMDGAELLKRIKELYPETIRIVMSGSVDPELSMRIVQTAHQFLAKPFSAEMVKNTINKAIALQAALNSGDLIKLITGLERLPSMPLLYKELLEEINASDPSIKRIGAVISKDIAMTGRVLQLVNSAFFGLPHRISNAQQAATLLGINTLKALVVSSHVFTSYSRNLAYQDYNTKLWHHSLQVGKLAKAIIESNEETAHKADDAFVSGLLHDIGKLLLLEMPEYFKNIALDKKASPKGCVKKELELLGATHGAAGGYFLGLWAIPNSILEPVIFHHQPGKSENYYFDILTAVHVADVLAYHKPAAELERIVQDLDYNYLNKVKVLDKLPGWLELAVKFETEVEDYGA